MSRKCEYCEELFSTNRALKSHQKSAQYCIQIQKRMGLDPKCEEYMCNCGQKFTIKGSLTRHKAKCKVVENEESKQTIIIDNRTINNITNNTINNNISNTLNHNTINNIHVDVHPFTIDKLTSEYIISKLTPVITKEAMKAGVGHITELIIELLLKNDGKYCYWCTDKSRKQFKMLINSDGEISVKDDPNAINLRSIMSFPLKFITLPFAADKKAGKSVMDTHEEFRDLKMNGDGWVTSLSSGLPKTPDGVDPQIMARAELEAADPEKLEQMAKLEEQVKLNKRRMRMAKMGITDDDL